MAGAVSVVPQRPHRTGHSPTLATADRRQEARGVVVGLRRTPGRTNPIRMIGSVLRRHRPHGRTTAGGFDQQESTRETSQRTSGLSFSQVALKNRQLVFIANLTFVSQLSHLKLPTVLSQDPFLTVGYEQTGQ